MVTFGAIRSPFIKEEEGYGAVSLGSAMQDGGSGRVILDLGNILMPAFSQCTYGKNY